MYKQAFLRSHSVSANSCTIRARSQRRRCDRQHRRCNRDRCSNRLHLHWAAAVADRYVKLNVPLAVGVPEITPLPAFNVNPDGKLPEADRPV